MVSPSGPVPADRLAAGTALLESWGLRVRLMDHADGTHEHFEYLAAADAARAADLTRAWTDPEVAGVVAARGGYGAQRMVDLLDWTVLARAAPKVLVGFSDITALHQAFAARLGVCTVHGPVLSSLVGGDPASREHLRALLLEPGTVRSLTPAPVTALVPGRAVGPLVGGNLAMLAAELGTPHSVPATGAIAVLEDVTEDRYRLDRLVTQLLRAGWFDGVRGVVLGEFTDCGPAEQVRALMADRLGPLGVPVLWGAPIGHGPTNLAFPCGVRAALDADAGTLTLLDPPLL